MEATRVREEWEHAISSKENANSQPSDDDASSDAYCFELLSMVLALSGSNVGRQYLAQQLTLLQDLFSLLHTASPRVQRQVCLYLRACLHCLDIVIILGCVCLHVSTESSIFKYLHF